MPYVGGKLAPWFNRGPVLRAMRRMADDGGAAMTRNVKAKTPVDKGHLRDDIRQKITVVTVVRGRLRFESGAETHVEYAPYVENPTGLFGPLHRRYVIRPKDPNGWLRWIDPNTGRPVFAKEVHHPGSPGAHMFTQGAALTEAEFDRVVAPALSEWAREQARVNPYAVGA